jgi:hypothetical protein
MFSSSLHNKKWYEIVILGSRHALAKRSPGDFVRPVEQYYVSGGVHLEDMQRDLITCRACDII